MGYMRHHAIVVTSWKPELLAEAHAKAREIAGALVSPIVEGVTNGYASFLIAPDGSNEGWEDSDRGDAQRAAFLTWADAQRYSDVSTALDWVEVQFGDGERETRIVNDSDAARRAQEKP